jgi:hypothetical protein
MLACLGALLSLSVTADAASSWRGNVFSSPTGNIRCRYSPSTEYVACITANDGWAEYLQRYGKPVHDHYSTYIGYGRTLYYGEHWTAPGFNCASADTGITCRTPKGHGFFISRVYYREW